MTSSNQNISTNVPEEAFTHKRLTQLDKIKLFSKCFPLVSIPEASPHLLSVSYSQFYCLDADWSPWLWQRWCITSDTHWSNFGRQFSLLYSTAGFPGWSSAVQSVWWAGQCQSVEMRREQEVLHCLWSHNPYDIAYSQLATSYKQKLNISLGGKSLVLCWKQEEISVAQVKRVSPRVWSRYCCFNIWDCILVSSRWSRRNVIAHVSEWFEVSIRAKF